MNHLNKTNLIILASIFIFNSCILLKMNLEGVYKVKDKKFGSVCIYEVRKDSTFTFKSHISMWPSTIIEGSWQKRGRILIFNSTEQESYYCTNKYTILEEKFDSTTHDIKISIVDVRQNNIPFANCIIYSKNKELYYESNLNGVFIIPKSVCIDSMRIENLGYKHITYRPLKNYNVFKFKMRIENQEHFFIKNEVFLSWNNKIISLYPKYVVYKKEE